MNMTREDCKIGVLGEPTGHGTAIVCCPFCRHDHEHRINDIRRKRTPCGHSYWMFMDVADLAEWAGVKGFDAMNELDEEDELIDEGWQNY